LKPSPQVNKISISSGAILECGGKRCATPLSHGEEWTAERQAPMALTARRNSFRHSESGVALRLPPLLQDRAAPEESSSSYGKTPCRISLPTSRQDEKFVSDLRNRKS
jgi:hypothetical protein